MKQLDHFLSCDWGTTNFRLRLIDGFSLKVLREFKSDRGIKTLYNQAKQLGQRQEEVFDEFLTTVLADSFADVADLSLVCSGMLSSTLGIKELAYAKLPLRMSGEDLITDKLILKNGKNLLLVSGARSTSEFMRGEEVQAIGLADHLPNDGTLILPGTHSKHLELEGKFFVEMKNFMTGELFSVLANHSILSSSIAQTEWDGKFKLTFLEGVLTGLKGGISSNLLSVRAKQMFEGQSPSEGYFHLSGLLIGDELSYLKNYPDQIYLAAGDVTFPLYRLALESFICPGQLTLFDNTALKTALFTGQRKILELHG